MGIYTNEIWKDIPGYEGLYQASTEGRIRSVSRYVRCGPKGKGQRFVEGRVLRPRPDGLDVCHNDGDPTNNRPSNLRYDTRTNNILDVYKNGGVWRKTTIEQVKIIRERLASGESGASIARDLGVTEQTVSAIKTGRSFYWLK